LTTPQSHILQTFLRRLTNLSGNSRSLLLLRLTSDQLIDLQSFSFLQGERAFSVVEALIAGKEKKLCALHDARMEAVNEASRRLRKLQRIDRFIFEEQGSNDLHVGWPIVRGKFSDGTPVRCPLLFFPVTLKASANDWVLEPREDAGIVLNKSFLLAYAFYNKLKPNEELLEISFDDFDTDSIGFRTQLYNLLKERIEINFNPDTYADEIKPFEEFRKEEFEEKHRTGELKLFPEAVLGIFPQAGSQLVPDYLTLLEKESVPDLEEFFEARTATDPSLLPWAVKEEKIYTPFPLDAYQEHAIRLTKIGKSVVVQGPPGTGKSQLICNLLADAIASGKRALLVCQKRVALDVVYDRLKKIDLEDFLGLVHDFRNDRKPIYEKIARQINRVEEYRSRNRGIDAIQLERRFFHVSRVIDQTVEELEEFRKYLTDESECGISIKALYLTSDPRAASVSLRQEYQYFTFPAAEDFIVRLKRYIRYAASLEADDHPWLKRKSFANYSFGHLREIETTVADLIETQEQLTQNLLQRLGASLSVEDAENLLSRRQDMEEMMGLLRDDVTWRYLQVMSEVNDDETSLLWVQNMERVCLNCFTEAGIEASLPSQQIGQCQAALYERMEARKNLFKRLRWEFFSDQKFFLKRVLIANNLLYNQEGFRTLEQRIDNRLNLEHHLTALRQKTWLRDLPAEPNRESLKTWFQLQRHAIRAKLLFTSLREVRDMINVQRFTREAFQELLREIFTLLSTLPFHRDGWEQYLTPFQIRYVLQQEADRDAFVQLLRRDFDKMVEFDKLKASLLPHERQVIDKVHDAVGAWNEESMITIFQNSIRLAWIDHIETKFPFLRMVSTLKMEELEMQLQSSVQEKEQLSEEITRLRARERVYESIQYNRLNNPTTYRDLLHQVTKKKKIWPIRKTVSEFHAELFNLVPCWLASPEAVSAIFPMEEFFDLVIFDEASQCFSERGIPAMYRGKQVVVAGDSKQLKPFELYQTRWEEETEHPDAEVDSLLALADRYLPSVHLRGHYRSQSLELIDFSNRHFYEGKLQLLPDRVTANQPVGALEYVKVEGLWENQTNPAEADRVVDTILNCLEKYPGKDIGVVTFNAPQQMLILDKLEDLLTERSQPMPDFLFVKNIENIQGDERDIIIFSIGYAPDKNQKMNMQFGSLNVAGGENRLNVAVTRARERIIVVSSIWPEALKLQGIRNDGPKLLREYLAFVRSVSEGSKVFSTAASSSDSWYLFNNIQASMATAPEIQLLTNGALPFVDLAVMRGPDYIGVILTDDAHYQSSLTVKEPLAYVPALLQQKDWKFHRIFSRIWWMNRDQTISDLAKFIYNL
jgi:hypothetical protein